MIVVLLENRSLDNMLGHLYGPEDRKTFEGVAGKALSNPIPDWAEDGAEKKVVPYTVATDMDAPNPDSGEEWYHTNEVVDLLREVGWQFFPLLAPDVVANGHSPSRGLELSSDE